MNKILDHIFFLRPMLLLPLFSVIILGARLAEFGHGSSPFQLGKLTELDFHLLLVLLSSALVYCATFIYNQVQDRKADQINGRILFVSRELVSVSTAYILITVFSVAGLILAFYSNTYVGVLLLIAFVIGMVYSHPKINFGARSGKALWSNMFGAGMIPFLIGWAVVSDQISVEAVFKSLSYLFAAGAIYLNSALLDKKGDAEVGKRTYAVIWTKDHLQTSALLRTLVAAVLAQMSGDFPMLIVCLMTLPFLIRARLTHKEIHSATANKIAILVISIMAVLYYPPFLLVAIVVFGATSLYYRHRFGIAFPSLKESARQ